MKFSVSGCALALVAAAAEVAAWGPRGSPNGPPGHYDGLHVHDSSFIPDHVLRLSYKTVPIGCQQRLSAVVNGTTPGPELRLQPGKTSWIRVYNDMTDQNATIVSKYA